MIESNEEYPLVTFALFAYNQERFIEEAVNGALSQDYPSLEIILSDDCSKDLTFEIMNKTAEKYSGSHVIRLNKNARNLGIADHINAVMKMVTTDFVVVAAGDDISEKNRTSEMVKVWLTSKRSALSVHSSWTEIDEDGVLTGKRISRNEKLLNDIDAYASSHFGVHGATHAWDMRLFRLFPPILSCVINEDVILPARAVLLGGRVEYIDKPLIKYRVDIGVSYQVNINRLAGKYGLTIPLLKRSYYAYLQKFRDYKHANQLHGREMLFARARATALYPIRLRKGRLSRLRFTYFAKHCSVYYLFREWVKYAFPNIVAFKQLIQFDLLPKLNNIVFKNFIAVKKHLLLFFSDSEHFFFWIGFQ